MFLTASSVAIAVLQVAVMVILGLKSIITISLSYNDHYAVTGALWDNDLNLITYNF